MLVQDKLLTAEEFANLPWPRDYRYELVEGRVVRKPMVGLPHDYCASRIAFALSTHVETHGSGVVLGAANCRVAENPDTVRLPDAMYISEARLLPGGFLPESYFDGAPDITVEVKSKGQSERALMARVDTFLSRGARMVWVVRIKPRTLTIYRLGEPAEVLTENDELDGGDVLPGFRYPLRRLFDRI